MEYRKILFRGKLSKKQTMNVLPKNADEIAPRGWVTGFYCAECPDSMFGNVKHNPHIIATGNPNKVTTGMWWAVNEKTVGQFTGILDDCNERIFEGDIVEVAHGGAIYYGVIEWQTSEARFLIHIKDVQDWVTLDDQTVHIVGNIYDNPELIES